MVGMARFPNTSTRCIDVIFLAAFLRCDTDQPFLVSRFSDCMVMGKFRPSDPRCVLPSATQESTMAGRGRAKAELVLDERSKLGASGQEPAAFTYRAHVRERTIESR